MYYRASGVSPLLRIFIVFLFCLALFLPSAYAAPSEGSAAEQGWVEVKAIVPEGFKENISVILQAADGSSRTIFVLPENGYVGRLKVNCGTYDVMSAGVVNDTKMRYPSDWNPYLVEVKSDASAAASIKVTVADPNGSYSPIIPSVSSPADPEQPDTSSDPTADQTVTAPSASSGTNGAEHNPDVDVSDPSTGDSSQDEKSELEQSKGAMKIVRDIIVSLVAMAVFLVIVCVIVYYVRKREF